MEDHQSSTESQRAVVSMRTMEIVVALLLLLIGAVVAWDSSRLGASWADDGPQAGYFPFYIGMIIVVSSLVVLVQTLMSKSATHSGAFVERGQFRQVFAVLGPAVIYVLAIQWFGIYLASAVYIAVFMVWLGNYSWFKAVALGLAVSVAVFFMFEIWFKVPLHKGTLYNPLAIFGF